MEYKIKFLQIDDYDVLIKLWQDSGLGHRPAGRDSYENICSQMNIATTRFMGFFIKNILAAAAIVSHNGRKGWINRLAVHPQFRRKNLATQMIAECENWLSSQDIHIYAVLIEDDNQASRQLFDKNNYLCHKDIIYYTKRKSSEV